MHNYPYFPEEADYESDLAIERGRADLGSPGISYTKRLCLPGTWEEIRVKNSDGAKIIMRPIGSYDTLNVKRLDVLDEEELYDVQEEIAKKLCALFDDISVLPARILIVGLGNRALTPDSIGPKTAEIVKPTMHIREYDEIYFDELECSELAVLSPGVTAQTGLDTGIIVKSVAEGIMPDAIIAIDSLSTKSKSRLGTTVQVCDTGIFPGGMYSLKTPITRRGVGVPVIGIGVPTVMSSRLQSDACHDGRIDLEPMYVSPREIDEITDNAAKVIGGAINQAFGLYG